MALDVAAVVLVLQAAESTEVQMKSLHAFLVINTRRANVMQSGFRTDGLPTASRFVNNLDEVQSKGLESHIHQSDNVGGKAKVKGSVRRVSQKVLRYLTEVQIAIFRCQASASSKLKHTSPH